MALEKKIDPPNVLFPFPGYLKDHFNRITNFGLYFQKFCRYQEDGINLKNQHSWNNGERGRKRVDYEWSILDNQNAVYGLMLTTCQPLMDNLHDRQSRYLEELCGLGSGVLEISARSQTPILTGIGETSPTEVGMLFDRNTGLPYITASSLKGAARYAYCVNFAINHPDIVRDDDTIEENNVPGLIQLFGTTDTNNSSRGGFAFMDTYSIKTPELIVDIMNPHHGKYYQNDSPEGPVETESPIPIKFLSVKKGFEYKFRGFFLTKEAEEFRQELIQACHTALTMLGIGAKTAVGYGRFDCIEDTTDAIMERALERKKLEKEKRILAIQIAEEKRILAEQKAEEERILAEKEAEEKAMEAKKAAEEKAYEDAIKAAEGIDRDILILRKKGNDNLANEKPATEKFAIDCYDKHLSHLKSLDEKERVLALLAKKQFNSWNKKTKKNKLKRRDDLNKLLKKKP